MKNYTDFTFIVREDFAFDEGLFSGYNPDTRTYDKSSWDYEHGRRRLREDRPHAAAPPLRLSVAQAPLRGLHPEKVEKHLRHAQGEVPARC